MLWMPGTLGERNSEAQVLIRVSVPSLQHCGRRGDRTAVVHDSAACDLDLQRPPVNSRDGATIQGVLTLQ